MKCEICGGVLSTYKDEFNIIHHCCPYCGTELEGKFDLSTIEEMEIIGIEDLCQMWQTI